MALDLRRMTAALAGLALVVALVARTSSAAFTATTANDGNSFDVGAIALTDDDGATALFSVSNLKPGDSVTRCITVTYTGDFATTDLTNVVLYASGAFTDAGTIAGSFNLDVDLGTGATDAACTSFSETSADIVAETLATFEARTGFATAASTTWNPSASPESRSFRVTVGLDSGASDAVQGQTLSNVGFTWELQTT